MLATRLGLAVFVVGCTKADAPAGPAPETIFESTSVAGKFIPEAATLVVGVDVGGLVTSSVYAANRAMIETGELERVLGDATACGLGTEKWKGITLGTDPTTRAFTAELHADGIGTDANLSCVHDKMTAREGKAPWTAEEINGKRVLTMPDGGVGYVVHSDLLVVASKEWAGTVRELVDDKGTSAFDGALKAAIGRADTGKTMWVAGRLPAEMVKGSPAEGATDVAASIELASGVALTASIAFGNVIEASKHKDALQQQFEQLKALTANMGVPQAVIDSVKIEARGVAVTVAVKASDDDMRKLQESLSKAM